MGTCSECKWWVRHILHPTLNKDSVGEPNSGTCRVDPPRYSVGGINNWPQTTERAFCKSFEPREEQ